MEKTRKISDCKSRRFHSLIIDLLKQKKPYAVIAKKVEMSVATISAIAKKNNLRHKVTRANTKRNEKLKKFLIDGFTYRQIAKKFDISPQRVQQLAKRIGISRWIEKRTYYKNIIDKINLDIANGLSCKEIQKNINIADMKLLNSLYRNGLTSLSVFFREKRNKKILSEFKNGKTAIEIVNSKEPVLYEPIKITKTNTIYRIANKAGIRKQPQVGNRSGGEISEKKEILDFVKLYRDTHHYSFKKIANLLNKKKHKTITGKMFYEQIVHAKYKTAKALEKKQI